MANPIAQLIISAVDRTKAAFASVKGGFASLGASASALSSQLGLIFTGLSVVGFVGALKSAIDRMDDAYNSAQKIGTSVENFSALSYAAKQSNVPIEELEKSLLKLARGIDAAKAGSGPAAEAFKRLGIDPKKFTDPADALLVIADRFAKLPNGVDKAALAMDLFSKAGANLIPLLNESSAGIKRMTDEAERFGVVVRDEAGAAADRFNDNLDKLKASGSGLGITLANDILPGLSRVTDAMAEAAKETGLLMAGIVGLGGLGAALFTDDLLTNTQKLANEKERLNEIIRGSLFLDDAAIAKQKEVIRQLEIEIEAEKKATAAKTAAAAAAAKTNEARREDSEKTRNAIVKDIEEEAKAFKKATDEKITDAQRLQGALQSAFSQALGEEKHYGDEAQKLRAKASSSPSGDQSQESIRYDATLNAMKLERLKANGDPEQIRDQAAAVKELASQLTDQAYASWLVDRATLAEAAAAEKSSAAAAERAKGLAEQMNANEARMESLKQATKEVSKPVSVDISTAGIDPALEKMREIKTIIDYIKTNPVSLNVNTTVPKSVEQTLADAARKFGRR